MRTRSRFRAHRRASTTCENDNALTVGCRILSVQPAGTDVPRFPNESRALFELQQVTRCTPRPWTGTCAPVPGYHCAGAPSSEQLMPAMPDGPVVAAVAVTYCTAAVVGASGRAAGA